MFRPLNGVGRGLAMGRSEKVPVWRLDSEFRSHDNGYPLQQQEKKDVPKALGLLRRARGGLIK